MKVNTNKHIGSNTNFCTKSFIKQHFNTEMK